MTVDFARDILPVFESTCWRCHGPERPKGHFRLDNCELALKGGDNGIDIIPGNAAKSPLIHYIARLVPDMEMPPPGKGEPLTPQQVGLFRAWIDQGASWGVTNPIVQFSSSASPAMRWISVQGDKSKFREIEGVNDVHDLHVWSIGSETSALSCHISIADIPPSVSERILRDVKECLHHDFRIDHTTIQFEHAVCEVAHGCVIPVSEIEAEHHHHH